MRLNDDIPFDNVRKVEIDRGTPGPKLRLPELLEAMNRIALELRKAELESSQDFDIPGELELIKVHHPSAATVSSIVAALQSRFDTKLVAIDQRLAEALRAVAADWVGRFAEQLRKHGVQG